MFEHDTRRRAQRKPGAVLATGKGGAGYYTPTAKMLQQEPQGARSDLMIRVFIPDLELPNLIVSTLSVATRGFVPR